MKRDVRRAIWTDEGWALELACGHVASKDHTTHLQRLANHDDVSTKTWFGSPPKRVECHACAVMPERNTVPWEHKPQPQFQRPNHDRIDLRGVSAYGAPSAWPRRGNDE